jgi:hypothetical protein
MGAREDRRRWAITTSLENGIPKAATLLEWARWFENHPDRVIEQTQVSDAVLVSTVFLGLDHRFGREGPAILFETMVFGGPMDQEMRRYATRGEAKRGHFEMVDECRKALTRPSPPPPPPLPLDDSGEA